VSVHVARPRVLVGEGYTLSAMARIMQITRQALYRVPSPGRRPSVARR
jgi:hypothetical protein